jgi:hypothetical protein
VSFLSIKIVGVALAVVAILALAGNVIELMATRMTVSAVVGAICNLSLLAGAAVTILMKKVGVILVPGALNLSVLSDTIFPNQWQQVAIENEGAITTVLPGALFALLLSAIYLACTLPHWKNMR